MFSSSFYFSLWNWSILFISLISFLSIWTTKVAYISQEIPSALVIKTQPINERWLKSHRFNLLWISLVGQFTVLKVYRASVDPFSLLHFSNADLRHMRCCSSCDVTCWVMMNSVLVMKMPFTWLQLMWLKSISTVKQENPVNSTQSESTDLINPFL